MSTREVMADTYAPRTGVREGRGVVTFLDGHIAVTAPEDYVGPWFQDPSMETGYVHAFLRPYRALAFGLLSRGSTVRLLSDPGFIVYPFFDASPVDGLRCPGALSVYRSRNGFDFVFFPALPRRGIAEREIDHLSAHINFENGRIRVGEIHAKVRLEGVPGPTENLPLDRLQRDDHHFAFEYWSRDIRFLDPAGTVSSGVRWVWTGLPPEARLQATIEESRPVTFTCSAPTWSGRVPIGSPVVVRVGLLTEEGRRLKGGTDAALSDPHNATLEGTRVHRYLDIRGIDSSWPAEVSLFVEVGLMKAAPPNDHNLPDLRGTSFERFARKP